MAEQREVLCSNEVCGSYHYDRTWDFSQEGHPTVWRCINCGRVTPRQERQADASKGLSPSQQGIVNRLKTFKIHGLKIEPIGASVFVRFETRPDTILANYFSGTIGRRGKVDIERSWIGEQVKIGSASSLFFWVGLEAK